MSRQNKWGGSLGKVGPSGGSRANGSNVYSTPESSPAPRANSSTSQNVITERFSPGDNMGTQAISTHNNIGAFTRGIKSRGPYGGPSFASLNHYESAAKSSNTAGISKFSTPSGGAGGTRGSAGGSSSKSGGSKVGSGSNKATSQMAKAPRSNKSGSGRQDLA